MFRKLFGFVRLIEPVTAMIAFAILIAVVSSNVALRFSTGKSLVFTEEVAYIAFGYLVFIGASLLFRERALTSVDIIVDALPNKIRPLANVLTYVVIIFVTGFFAYLSLELALSSWLRTTAFLRIPYFWIYLAPAVSFGLMTAYSCAFVIAELHSGAAIEPRSQEQL